MPEPGLFEDMQGVRRPAFQKMHKAADTKGIVGSRLKANPRDFSDAIAFKDHKIGFLVKYCDNKDVLELGCVQHDPQNYQSRYWAHKAIRSVARSVLGLDIYREGVDFLVERGFNVEHGDAQNFHLCRKFDVIVAGDLIEHLENFHGFMECSREHMHDDSRLLISTPNPWYWEHIVKAALFKEIPVNPEHTCWLCPRTLRQLVQRHDLDIIDVVFGSRYLRQRLMPLPQGWKHTSFHAAIALA